MTEFDPSRPLWAMTLVEGLTDGGAALVVKLHHSLTDGLGAVQLGWLLFETTPEPGPVPPVEVAGARARAEWAGTHPRGAGALAAGDGGDRPGRPGPGGPGRHHDGPASAADHPRRRGHGQLARPVRDAGGGHAVADHGADGGSAVTST